MGALYIASPKIRGPSPKEIGAKNMQNSARFLTISDFDREYLRNGLKIQGVRTYNFGGSGNNVTKLFQATYREAGVQVGTIQNRKKY